MWSRCSSWCLKCASWRPALLTRCCAAAAALGGEAGVKHKAGCRDAALRQRQPHRLLRRTVVARLPVAVLPAGAPASCASYPACAPQWPGPAGPCVPAPAGALGCSGGWCWGCRVGTVHALMRMVVMRWCVACEDDCRGAPTYPSGCRVGRRGDAWPRECPVCGSHAPRQAHSVQRRWHTCMVCIQLSRFCKQ